jgi:hypothetical protein
VEHRENRIGTTSMSFGSRLSMSRGWQAGFDRWDGKNFYGGRTTSGSFGSQHWRSASSKAGHGIGKWNVRGGLEMGDVVLLKERSPSGRRTNRPRCGSRCVVRAFPGKHHLQIINNIASHMATLDDATEEEFLIFHFEIEERRLIEQGIAEPEIDRYIFETARAIWARLRKIRKGAA